MKLKNILYLFSLFITLLSCDEEGTKEEVDIFPEVKKLSEYENTLFVPALEQEFDADNNAVYAVSLLYAWDAIKNIINDPISKIDSRELKTMDKSDSYQNVLKSHEYSVKTEVEDEFIKAFAYFKKSLPFEEELNSYDVALSFKGIDVENFGFNGGSEYSRILFYNDDNDFAISLLPKDDQHEIILLKTKFKNKIKLKNVYLQMEKQIEKFTKNKKEKNSWKYYYNDDDIVRIPKLAFNIETNYSEIEGSFFETKNKRIFQVIQAYQRTAFILNEKGAEVESEAYMEAKEEGEFLVEAKPKKMVFDNSFVVFLKRKGSAYPYFALYINNTELMSKMAQ